MDPLRFSGQVESVLADAAAIGRVRGHAWVGTEHLLLALARSDDGSFARRLLDELGVTEQVRHRIEQVIGPDPPSAS